MRATESWTAKVFSAQTFPEAITQKLDILGMSVAVENTRAKSWLKHKKNEHIFSAPENHED